MNEKRLKEPKLLSNRPVSLLKCNEEKVPENFLSLKFTYIREIQTRAETITPLLKGILDYKPAPSWNL